jgi:SPP1 gp7 family putative phage head morphogenesis protein
VNMLAHRIAMRRPAIPKRLPRQLQPDAIRLRYFAKIRKTLIADMRAWINRLLVPELPKLAAKGQAARGVNAEAKADAADDLDVGEILDEIADRMAAKWTREKFVDLVQPFAQDTAQFQAAQLNKQLEALVGVDVIGTEPWLGDALGAWVKENVALIKTIPVQAFGEIEKTLTASIANGDRWETMAEDLQDRLGVSESRANLIARDQTGKLYGDLNRVRQTDLGITRYTWRTMRDNRVRDEHEERDGEVFEWDGPPEDGNPGEPIQCRCYAEPDIGHLLESHGVDTSGLDVES